MVERVEFKSEDSKGDAEYLEKMAAKGAALRGEPTDSPKEDPNTDRPAWLPEKFKSPEDMAAAYAELEKKQGRGTGTTEPKSETSEGDPPKTDLNLSTEKAEEALQEKGFDMAALRKEYAENQSLSDETYDKLEKSGLSRSDVDAYIEGQKAIARNIQQQGYDLVGGEENYKSMAEWARENMSYEEREQFNKLVNTAEGREFAIRGLYSKYQSQVGKEPARMVGGERAASASDVYNSRAEVVADMATEKYKKDPAERQRVADKIARKRPW